MYLRATESRNLKQEDTVDFQIKRTWQNIVRMYNEVASDYGATMTTGYILLNLDTEIGTPASSLGPKMGVEVTSLSRTLKSMEERDLIYRKPNPDDGRSVLVYLTPFGKEKREDAKNAVLDFNFSLMRRIDDKKLQIFFEVISDINTLINNKKIEFKP